MPRKTKERPARARTGEVADQLLQVRVRPAEVDAYRLAADRAGMNLSQWVLSACAAQLGQSPPRRADRTARLIEDVRVVLERYSE